MAKKSRRKLPERSGGYSRAYHWGSQTFHQFSTMLTFGVLICVVGGILLSKSWNIPMKYVLLVALTLLSVNEWVRAIDNKTKGGPKKFTISFTALGVAMFALGVVFAIKF